MFPWSLDLGPWIFSLLIVRQPTLVPPSSQRLDELDGDRQALASQLGLGALGLQPFPAGIDDFEVAHNAASITVGRQFSGAARVCHGPVLRLRLRRKMMNAGEAVFDFAECDEDLLAIFCNRFLVSGLGALVGRAVAAPGEEGQRNAG